MMIKIEFECDPTEYAGHLMALVRGLGDAPEIERLEKTQSKTDAALLDEVNAKSRVWAHSPTVEELDARTDAVKAQVEASAAIQVSQSYAAEQQAVLDGAASALASGEPTRRRGRPARTETPTPTPKIETAAISTGEERVDPQDAADEAAEAAAARAANGGKLTLNDVRNLGAVVYKEKYGIEAVIKDIPIILGHQISELPNTQEAISAAMAKIQHALDHGRPAQPAAPKPETVKAEVTKTEPAVEQKAETSLFGDPEPPKSAEPPRATQAEFQQACMDYSKRFDPKMATDPLKSQIMQVDVNLIAKQATGLSDPKAIFADPALLYKVVAAVRQAIQNNPFNRN